MAITIDFRHIQRNCRICLNHLKKLKYNVEQLPKDIFRIFQQMTGFHKEEHEKYPKSICSTCYNKIKKFSDLKIECLENKKFLKSQIDKKLQKAICVDKIDETENADFNQRIENTTQNVANQNELKAEIEACDDTEQDNRIFENIFVSSGMKEENNEFERSTLNLPHMPSSSFPQAQDTKVESSGDEHPDIKTTCKICNLTYSTAALLKMHMRVHKELRLFKCNLCDRSFSKKSHFNQHTKKACEETFSNTKSAETHNENLHNFDESCVMEEIVNQIDKSNLQTKHHSTDESADENFDLFFVSKTTCKICKTKTFSSPAELELHVRLHEEEHPFQCDKCERSFDSEHSLSEHVQAMHAEKALEIICKFGCGKSFLRAQTAGAHYRKKHSPNTNSQEDTETKTLEVDISQKAAETSNLSVLNKLTCDICFQTYSSASTLRVHKRLHRDKRPFQCDQCERSFNKEARLKLHIQECHTNIPIEIACKFGCGKVFRRSETAKNHYYTKHRMTEKDIKPKEKSFVCENCGLLFKTMSTLRYHSFTHRSPDDRPYKCGQCAKTFASKPSYKDHLLRHTGIKNYECSYCGLKKVTLKELRQHVKNHTNKRTFTCAICSKVFNRSVKLRLHERTVHQGIRRYKCSYCDEAFGKSDTLKHHIMRHTGERPHKCNICDRGFIQSVALRSHMKTHAK